MDYRKFVEVKQELRLTLSSEHFSVHYGLRNPRCGRGLGPNGVGDPVLLRWYLSALERLYRAMSSPPWNRPAPKTDASGKTRVYVCDLDRIGIHDPFTSADRERNPFIVLSCRSYEPLTDGAMRRAAAEAVHEATHVFNARERPFDRPVDFPWWAWLNEAMATYMESVILPGNQDYFRFLANWIDVPGIALNDWRAAYQGCLFLHYLARAVDHGFPNRIWTDSGPGDKPLATIDRLASESGQVFATADAGKRDLFAQGYAMDSYFLRDHTGGCFAPDLCCRFGDRAVVETFELSAGDPAGAVKETLPHLASHYFRCFVGRNVDRVRLTLRALRVTNPMPFKVEAAIVRADLSCGQRQLLLPVRGRGRSGSGVVTAEVTGVTERDFDHLVLVVSNCTHENKDLPMDHPLPLGDAYEFEIAVT